MGTEPKLRTKRYVQNHVVYQRTEMILQNPLASPVRGVRQNGHAPSHAFGWAQKAINAGSMVISLDRCWLPRRCRGLPASATAHSKAAVQPHRTVIFFFLVVHNLFAF